MTTVLCDGEYLVADRRSTCSRPVGNNHAEGNSTNANYRFAVEDINKIAKVQGLKINEKPVKALAIGGSATEASDFLRDLKEFITTSKNPKGQYTDLRFFLKMRAVFKVPFSASFSILFLAEGKEVTVMRVSASTKRAKNADGHTYSTEMFRIKHYDFSDTGKHKGEVVGIGSGSEFYNELDGFLQKPQPGVLDTFVYCVNRDRQYSSRDFSVYSLSLDHLDNSVKFPEGEFDERLKRFVSHIDLTKQPLGTVPIAVRVTND